MGLGWCDVLVWAYPFVGEGNKPFLVTDWEKIMLETLYDNILDEWHEIVPDFELDDETVANAVENIREKLSIKQCDEWSASSLASLVRDAKGDEEKVIYLVTNYLVSA